MSNSRVISLIADMATPCWKALRPGNQRAQEAGFGKFLISSRRSRILLAMLIPLFACTTRGAYADFTDTMHDPVSIGDPDTYRDYADEAYKRMLKKRKERREEEERQILEMSHEEEKREAQQAQSDTDKRKDKDHTDSDSDDYWKPKRDKDNGLTGSQFDAPDFMDTDFSKNMFVDLLQSSAHREPELDLHIKLADHVTKDDDEEDDGIDSVDMDKTPISEDDRKELEDKSLDLHDWVPSPPDKSANGGFGLDKDNGRPVPYRLNGHLEINRGLPWKPQD